jgi:Ser/Thr protein kinase RdoA (MazF antagonist)
MTAAEISSVLRQYPLAPPDRVVPLQTDGLSGARLWQVHLGPARFCLRSWPPEASPARLQAIFQFLHHVANTGLMFIPVPLLATDNRRLVTQGSRCWSLEPWLPGQADRATPPNQARLRSALRALAQFHEAAASYPGDSQFSPSCVGRPPGLTSRCQQLDELLAVGLVRLTTFPVPARYIEVAPRRAQLLPLVQELAPALQASLVRACQLRTPVQVVLRDVWSAHVLFGETPPTSDAVTGIVDFDALRIDSVATDLARLLGSYAQNDAAAWQQGLAAYEEVRPLSAAERQLVAAYDQTAVLLTGVTWLQWVLVEKKTFPLHVVLARLDATLSRLEHLSRQLRTTRSGNGGQIAVDP